MKILIEQQFKKKLFDKCNKVEQGKNENIKEIMGVKGKPDIIDIIERKRLQWYGHVRRMPEERIPKLIMECITWRGEKGKGTSKEDVDGRGYKQP